MAEGNYLEFTGVMGRDATVRYLPSGTALADISLCHSKRWKDKATGEWKEKLTWLAVTMWARLAEEAAELRKGEIVKIIGRLEEDTWLDKDSGAKRTKIKAVADSFERMERRERSDDQRPQGNYGEEAQASPVSEDTPF